MSSPKRPAAQPGPEPVVNRWWLADEPGQCPCGATTFRRRQTGEPWCLICQWKDGEL